MTYQQCLKLINISLKAKMRIGVTKSSCFRDSLFRVDPSFHLSDGIRVRSQLSRSPYGLKTVSEDSERIFIGNIFSRVFVKNDKHGVLYLAASDTVMENLDTGRYLSKKQVSELSYLLLGKGWILVTCSGTLGNTSYTSQLYEGKIATHDLIRIVPNEEILLGGCLYAFLSSSFGYYQLTQSKFGGVVKHVNETQAGDVLVPDFPLVFQTKIDRLIKDSANRREEAQNCLDKALRLFLDANRLEIDPVLLEREERRICNNWVLAKEQIMDCSFKAMNYSRRSHRLFQILEQTDFVRLSDFLAGPFRMGSRASFKRIGAEYNGVDIVSQSDIHRRNPKNFKQVRVKSERENSRVCRASLIMPSAGTLGENEIFTKPLLVRNNFEGKLLSEVIGTFDCKSEEDAAYLFIFLSSKIGFRLLRNMTCGTNLMYPQWAFMKDIPIPICDKQSYNEIANLVLQAFDYRSIANDKENEAISMIEDEISSWK